MSKPLFNFMSLVSAILISQFVYANTNQLSPSYSRHVNIIKGSELPMLLGKSSKNFSIMVIKDNTFTPIPYQFDDVDILGFPYVPNGYFEINGKEDIIEPQDELVFMLRDTGEKASADQIGKLKGSENSLVAELSFQANDVSYFAYVVENNAERSDKYYAFFDQKTGLVSTDKYTLQTTPDDILIWGDLMYFDYEPGVTIFDTMKLRIRAKLGFIKATIYNDLIPTKIIAVKNGPIRSLVSFQIKIALLGIKLANAGSVMTFSEEAIKVPVFAHIPSIAATLSDLSIDISVDFNDFSGAKVRTALGPSTPMIVGSDAGSKPEDQKISIQNNWVSGTSEKGFDVVAFFKTPDSFNPNLGILYYDAFWGAKPDKPERFEGSHPEIGYHIKNIPHNIDALFTIELYFGDNFWNYGIEKTLKEFQSPPVLSAQNL